MTAKIYARAPSVCLTPSRSNNSNNKEQHSKYRSNDNDRIIRNAVNIDQADVVVVNAAAPAAAAGTERQEGPRRVSFSSRPPQVCSYEKPPKQDTKYLYYSDEELVEMKKRYNFIKGRRAAAAAAAKTRPSRGWDFDMAM